MTGCLGKGLGFEVFDGYVWNIVCGFVGCIRETGTQALGNLWKIKQEALIRYSISGAGPMHP